MSADTNMFRANALSIASLAQSEAWRLRQDAREAVDRGLAVPEFVRVTYIIPAENAEAIAAEALERLS